MKNLNITIREDNTERESKGWKEIESSFLSKEKALAESLGLTHAEFRSKIDKGELDLQDLLKKLNDK